MAQLIGVAILEFGVILHRCISFIVCLEYSAWLTDLASSVLIGLTLAVDERFKVLFIVIIFHRMYHLFIKEISPWRRPGLLIHWPSRRNIRRPRCWFPARVPRPPPQIPLRTLCRCIPLWHHDALRHRRGSRRAHNIQPGLDTRELGLRCPRQSQRGYPFVHGLRRASRP
jgi:hypothetical protein